MAGLTYLALGDAEAPGPVLRWPRAPARIAAIYAARVQAVREVDADAHPWVCWADGGEDSFSQEWPHIWPRLMRHAEGVGAAIGYCDETQADGEHFEAGDWSLARMLACPQMIHHAAICRTAALQALEWPEGCFNWETLAYGMLAQRGWAYAPQVGYHWRPTPGGAHSWADTQRGIVNALRHLQGLPGVHFADDKEPR